MITVWRVPIFNSSDIDDVTWYTFLVKDFAFFHFLHDDRAGVPRPERLSKYVAMRLADATKLLINSKYRED